MTLIERSAVVHLSPNETWEAFYGNQMQNWVELSDSTVEVRDYEVHDDGTPEYVIVDHAGPLRLRHRSVYRLYDPPFTAVDDEVDSSLGGMVIITHREVEGGTLVTHRWDVRPHGVMRLLFPLLRRGMERSFQEDLDHIVERIEHRDN